MIVIMERRASPAQIEHVVARVEELGFRAHLSRGEERTIIGIIGDERPVAVETLEVLAGVERVVPVLQPFKLASRDFKPDNSIVKIKDVMIGGEEFTVLRQSPELPKPFFSPVNAPGGAIITRPINDTEDKDHPHHKGVWLSVDEVNEVKFWAEKGQILVREFQADPGNPARLKLSNEWVGPEGQVILPFMHPAAVQALHRLSSI